MNDWLRPSLGPNLLYPLDAAFMARTDLHQTRMLGYAALQLDTVTATLMGLLNGHATVRHETGAGAEVLRLFRRAGPGRR